MDCWHHELDRAQTEAEILQGATDYLQLWAPRDMDATRLGLVELRIDSADDVERVRRSLGNGQAAAASSAHVAHLRELATYFGHAATRIRELREAQSFRLTAASAVSASPAAEASNAQ